MADKNDKLKEARDEAKDAKQRVKEVKKKGRRRTTRLLVVILILVLIIAGLFLLGNQLGWWGESDKPGTSSGGNTTSSADASTPSDNSSDASDDAVLISITENGEIYFDGNLCADENDLKDKVSGSTSTKFKFKADDHAKVDVYEKVTAVLKNVRDAANSSADTSKHITIEGL